jgi:hypothetical protein
MCIRDRAYEVLDIQNAGWFENLSEQYAIQSVFLNSGYTPIGMSCKDVCFGREIYNIEYLEDDVKIITNTTALHYFGSCNWLFLPKEYLTESEYQYKLQRIQQRDI